MAILGTKKELLAKATSTLRITSTFASLLFTALKNASLPPLMQKYS